MNTYDHIPIYHWYTAKKQIEGDYRAHWIKGKQYIRFNEEPSYEEIERHDLRFKCIGDIDMIRG